MESVKTFEKRMLTMSVPEGFTFRFEDEDIGWQKTNTRRIFILEKPEDTKLVFDHSEYGAGHTSYFKDGHWYSFDRIGVSDSFSHVKISWAAGSRNRRLTGKALDRVVNEQLEAIAKRREYNKTAIKIPGIPHTVSPAGIQGLKDSLKQNKCLHFSPSGFGTGYTITLKPVQGLRFGEKKAPKELEDFLGQSPLYIHTFDAD